MGESDYVEIAENAIKKLKEKVDNKGKKIPLVTTSKIRNLLATAADIYNEVINQTEDKLSEQICERINYLRVRFIYEAGRDLTVKEFVLETKILERLKEINGSKKNFINFNRYMEALVAFHKFYGGEEN